MTSSNGHIFRATGPLCGEFTGPGEFPTQRPVTRSFDVFFDLRLNKRLSKQPWSWWFETLSWSLWRHRNVSPWSIYPHCGILTYQWYAPIDFVKSNLFCIAAILSWWCHLIETFSALLTICAGNSLVTGEFPAQRPATRSFDVFFDLAWTNGWVSNRDAGDLRRHLAHYDVTVIVKYCSTTVSCLL